MIIRGPRFRFLKIRHRLQLSKKGTISVVDRLRYDADPAQTCHFDVDPVADPDPTSGYIIICAQIFFHSDASLHYFIFLISVIDFKVKYFVQHIEIFWKKVRFIFHLVEMDEDLDPERPALEGGPDPAK